MSNTTSADEREVRLENGVICVVQPRTGTNGYTLDSQEYTDDECVEAARKLSAEGNLTSVVFPFHSKPARYSEANSKARKHATKAEGRQP